VLDNPYESLDVPSLVALNDMMPRVTQTVKR